MNPSPQDRAARIALWLAAVPFCLYVANWGLVVYADRFGEQALVRGILSELVLITGVAFVIWVLAAFAAVRALRLNKGRSMTAWISLALVVIPTWRSVATWYQFLTAN